MELFLILLVIFFMIGATNVLFGDSDDTYDKEIDRTPRYAFVRTPKNKNEKKLDEKGDKNEEC